MYPKTILRRSCLPLLLVLTACFQGQVQEGKGVIHGVLRDSLKTVAFAGIGLENTAYSVISDEHGRFTLTDVPAGSYRLVVSAMGYSPASQIVVVVSDSVLNLVITLHEVMREIDPVLISAKSETRKMADMGFQVNMLQTRQFANLSTDLNQLLNRSTGVRIRLRSIYKRTAKSRVL